jgi:acetoin utilization deacetylase AcuC-like enzyme
VKNLFVALRLNNGRARPLYMNLYYHPDYCRPELDFATTRKAGWVYADLVANPLPGLTWVEPEPVTEGQLAFVHTAEYINAIKTGKAGALAQSSGLKWDTGVWKAVTRSTGGAVAAAMDALKNRKNTGSLSSGLHHARRGAGAGFCTFNGLALAAKEALLAGAQRVLILDLDAHGGGGTHRIIKDEPRIVQLDLMTCDYDDYWAHAPSVCRLVKNAESYLPLLASHLDELETADFDLCLYNAGVDPHEDDEVGGISGITAELLQRRDAAVFNWARRRDVPVSFVLAGGYPNAKHTQAAVVALHRQTVAAGSALGRAPNN